MSEILELFPPEFKHRIHVYRNKFNIGMSGNIASLFQKADAEWCWFLSDDDFPDENAIKNILDDISSYEDDGVSVIQYPHFDIKRDMANEYAVMSGLEDYISYFQKLNKRGVPISEIQGTLIYMSNKVYRISEIAEYIRFAYDYCNTGIPQVIPILKALDDGVIKMLLHNRPIVKYNNDGKESWNVRTVALGVSTIRNLPLSINIEKKRQLWYLLMIRYRVVLRDYVKRNCSDFDYLKYLFDNIYMDILEAEHLKYYEEVLNRAKLGMDKEYIRETLL